MCLHLSIKLENIVYKGEQQLHFPFLNEQTALSPLAILFATIDDRLHKTFKVLRLHVLYNIHPHRQDDLTQSFVFMTALLPDEQHLLQSDKSLLEEELAHLTASLHDLRMFVFDVEVVNN